MNHLGPDARTAGLDRVCSSPATAGVLDLIVRRPAERAREVLAIGELSLADGLVGDNWRDRPSTRTAAGGPHPDMQLNVINARLSALVAGVEPADRALAGDQLHVDLDLRPENLPPGTRLAIGPVAVIEITDQPHTGCPKFAARFGVDALRFVSTGPGRELRLRGLNAKVVLPGVITQGDVVIKL